MINGVIVNDNSTNLSEGSVISFQCDPGFSLVGEGTATCNNSGLWYPDPALLECVSGTQRTTRIVFFICCYARVNYLLCPFSQSLNISQFSCRITSHFWEFSYNCYCCFCDCLGTCPHNVCNNHWTPKDALCLS